MIIVCCDGLSGLGEEITAAWPQATVQSCVVHLIRAAARYGSYTDRKALCAAMRPIYTAADMDAAEAALLEFADSALGRKYPAAATVWERAWDRFVPFLEFEPGIDQRRLVPRDQRGHGRVLHSGGVDHDVDIG